MFQNGHQSVQRDEAVEALLFVPLTSGHQWDHVRVHISFLFDLEPVLIYSKFSTSTLKHNDTKFVLGGEGRGERRKTVMKVWLYASYENSKLVI